jgi:hypothetical protein
MLYSPVVRRDLSDGFAKTGRVAGVNEQLRLGAWLLAAFGVILLLVSLFADPLAIGQPGTSFGWKQMLGSVVGLALAIVGIVALRRSGRRRDHH